jgi:hypothetical protein
LIFKADRRQRQSSDRVAPLAFRIGSIKVFIGHTVLFQLPNRDDVLSDIQAQQTVVCPLTRKPHALNAFCTRTIALRDLTTIHST